MLRIYWRFELMLNANFSGFFVLIVSISVIFVANNERKRKRNVLQFYNNSRMRFSCRKWNWKKFHEKSVKQNWWWQTCISWMTFVLSTKLQSRFDKTAHRENKKLEIPLQTSIFFFNFLFFYLQILFFLFNIIITLVCCEAQKLMRPEWAWIDALHGPTTLLTNRTTTITITANSRRAGTMRQRESWRMGGWMAEARMQRNGRRFTFKGPCNILSVQQKQFQKQIVLEILNVLCVTVMPPYSRNYCFWAPQHICI